VNAARCAVLTVLLVVPAWGQPGSELHSPKDGRYQVKFPGRPKDTKQTVRSELGDLRLVTATYANADGHTWFVTYTDYPAAAIAPGKVRQSLLDALRDGLKGMNGKVVSEKEIESPPAKVPGREVVLDRGKETVRARLLVKDNRLYQVAVLGLGEFATGKDATAFLDSFEVK
jgi:hypothetical protein